MHHGVQMMVIGTLICFQMLDSIRKIARIQVEHGIGMLPCQIFHLVIHLIGRLKQK